MRFREYRVQRRSDGKRSDRVGFFELTLCPSTVLVLSVIAVIALGIEAATYRDKRDTQDAEAKAKSDDELLEKITADAKKKFNGSSTLDGETLGEYILRKLVEYSYGDLSRFGSVGR